MTTTGSVTAVTGSGKEGPEAITSAEDIRAQGGLLVLDGNKNYNLSPNNGYEGGVTPASGALSAQRSTT